MSRLSRRLAGLAARAGLGGSVAERAERERRRRAGWRWPLDDSLLRRLERVTVSAARPAASGLGGEHRSRARAASTDFADYRRYQPGDDYRQIDWNVYGRLDQLYVKLTEARERLPLHLLLDCSASMDAGSPNKHDYARQLAAAIGYVALARYDRVHLAPLAGSGPAPRPLRGRQRFSELVEMLGGLRPGGSFTPHEALAHFRPAGPSGRAVLISDMLHPAGFEGGLEALAAAGLEPSVIQVLSRQELSPEAGGDVELVDVESGETVPVGLSPAAVDVYRQRLAKWCEGIERACRRRGLRYLRVSTDQPLEQVSLVALRQAGILN